MKKILLLTTVLLAITGAGWWAFQAPSTAVSKPIEDPLVQQESKPPTAPDETVSASPNAKDLGDAQRVTGGEKTSSIPFAIRKKSVLDTESRLIRSHTLSLEPTHELLRSNDFEKFVLTLNQEAALDSEAQNNTDAYQNEAQQMLREVGGTTTLNSFACGLSMCIGSMFESMSTYSAWRKKLLTSRRVKFYSLVDNHVGLAPQNVEHRFAISIDPSIGAIVSPSN